ncbi:unnamed protein product [Rhizoctonia solani]|uniref:Uncharacterized protein n=1 Tax=Rhizoctonia solani TaxID=456999 RepID=A0A8H3HZF0_9AGAM|nr:unnamed protein product [Rhizoctonia solani]
MACNAALPEVHAQVDEYRVEEETMLWDAKNAWRISDLENQRKSRSARLSHWEGEAWSPTIATSVTEPLQEHRVHILVLASGARRGEEDMGTDEFGISRKDRDDKQANEELSVLVKGR